jgi:ComF family protein
VPLHRHKRKQRGYNQAGLLAKALSNHFKIPLNNDIIANTKIRTSQTKLAKTKRQENVEGIFRVKEGFAGKNIILIDDIVTTGATIDSCCRALRRQQAGEICVIALARALDS